MLDIIQSLVGEGATVLLTTQYLEEADQLADSISVIDDGRVIAEGTADELKASIGGQRIEVNLVSAEDSAVAASLLARYGTAAPAVSADGRALTMNAEDAPSALRSVLADLGERGIRLYDAGMRRPTLDDVFLRLTGHAATAETDPDHDGATAPGASSPPDDAAAPATRRQRKEQEHR
jgi:ABC-2 type transport system ATP-binding protein